MTKPTIAVPDWLRDVTAVVVVALFAVYLGWMISNIAAQDATWNRYLTILNVAQAFAAAAAGILLGTTIKTEQVKTAEMKAQAADATAQASDTKAQLVTNNLTTLANEAQRALQSSRSSPGKWLVSPRPARRDPASNFQLLMTAEPTVAAEEATHWVAPFGETRESDPELERLAALAKDLAKS